MFSLHEQTRILLCRLAFVLLCAVPTICVAWATYHYRGDSYIEARREDWMAVLSDKLNLDVRIKKLSYPLWNLALLEEVALVDPETDMTLATARYLEVTTDEHGWTIVASHPEIQGDQLGAISQLIETRLLCGRAFHLAPLAISANQLTIRRGDTAQTFQDVSAKVVTIETGKRATIEFKPVGAESAKLSTLTLERIRQGNSPRTICKLETRDASLPCSTLAGLLPALESLGPQPEFRGTATVEQRAGQFKTNLRGVFTSVELENVLARRFPQHRFTGSAELALDSFQMDGGEIVEAKGTLRTTGGGMINRALLDALAERLQLAPVRASKGRDGLVRYSQLAFGFDLTARGLSISGVPDPPYEGVIMASGQDGVLLTESAAGLVPPTAIVQALATESDSESSMSRASKALYQWLPTPASSAGQSTATRIRLIPIRRK